MWLDHLDHQADYGSRREKLSAFRAFATCELSQEVFVNLSEQVASEIGWDIGKVLEQLVWYGFGLLVAGKAEVFVFRKYTFKFGLIVLNGLHGRFDCLRDILLFWKVEQVVVTRLVWQIESALLNGDFRKLLLAPGTLELLIFSNNFSFVPTIVVVREFQKNQP